MGLGLGLRLWLWFLLVAFYPLGLESSCRRGCDLAIGSYYVSAGLRLNLTYIGYLFNQTYQEVFAYNHNLSTADSLPVDIRINVSFPCDCLGDGAFLGRTFSYRTISGDTYTGIASTVYANLTTVAALTADNSYQANRISAGSDVNVTVNCSCGDPDVSRDYGLFVTYPLRAGESLGSVAAEYGFSSQKDLLQSYNPGLDFSVGKGIVFVPTKDLTGSYRPLPPSKSGLSGAAIAGISIAVLLALLLLGIYMYFGHFRRKKREKLSLLPSNYEVNSNAERFVLCLLHVEAQARNCSDSRSADKMVPDRTTGLTPGIGGASQRDGLVAEKSVEFSYEELTKATNDFSMLNKIGEGGFGAVYYAELRGERAAIKKMKAQSSREFIAELKVLTRVHHSNLVRLLGYCIEDSLFLVYEYIDNGDLSHHLRGSGKDPLPWSTRMQIALDAARGLEYIHEHTVPVYIHRDIKSANILIDKNFRGKVADFGLTKLTEVGNMTIQTRLVGTFGYMPPEYAIGDVSPKVDVYAFGVVLYEIISAKEAVIKSGAVTESKGLVSLFEDALNQSDPREHLRRLVDERLGDDYPIDLVYKMALLAKACTQDNPHLRPSMRTVVVSLMTLSSNTEDWDANALYANQAFVNLMSGK
ncbi:chitin elicitor receptor kinase 1-like [Typha angustifolia]|uniref:chitin elicitor receptor kinase 1-like n=1 Tax=Typha angustifolia TaxID=59011 RepID=UPI003C2D32D6